MEKRGQAVCSRKGWPGMQAPLVLPRQGWRGRRGERRTRRGGEEERLEQKRSWRWWREGEGVLVKKEKGGGKGESENWRSVTIACRLERQTYSP